MLSEDNFKYRARVTSSNNADKKFIASRRKVLLAAGVGIVPTALLAQGCSAESAPVPAATEQPQRAAAQDEPRQYASVPDRARPPEIPATGLVDDLGGGLYGFRNGRTQSMFLVTRTGVVVMDASASAAEPMMAAIQGVTDRPVTHFVYSHNHADHVGGASSFGDKVLYVAHELTADRLKLANDPRRPVPTLTFAGDRHVLNVGGQRLILNYHGNVHAEGNLFIHAPDHKTLMLVDVIAARWAPYFELGLAHYIPRYMKVLNEIIPSYDFETLTGGHGGWFGTRADVEEQGRYVTELATATRQATDDIRADPSSIPEVDPDNQWAGSQVYYNTIADRAAGLMSTSWLTQLGGADVFLRENTHAMAYSVGLD